MSPFLPEGGLCGCLTRCTVEELPAVLAHPGLDLLEWRLDTFSEIHGREKTVELLSLLSMADRRPVIATNRLLRDGGNFGGDEGERMNLLKRAVEAGADWIDLEDDVDGDSYWWFRSSGCGVIVSHHDLAGTPSTSHLQKKLEQMASRGAHVIKIATLAKTPEDNLRILHLIPLGKREFNARVIAFCMGREGRWSRAACLLLGSPWSYVRLPGKAAAAPGQLSIEEMRCLLELLR